MKDYVEKLIFCRKFQESRDHPHVDILNARFVDEFAAEFKCKIIYTNYGANRVPELNKFLSLAYKNGSATRRPCGIQCRMSGVPSWVYVYNFKI